jgi:hypothetical protein
MQLLSAFPQVANLAYQLKDFVIGYLHLVFLGIVITTMLTFLNFFKLIHISKSFIITFIFAFFTTELLIFYKAIALWLVFPFFQDYYLILAILSCSFLVTVGILFFQNIKSLYLST